MLPPGRQMELRAKMLLVFVAVESTGLTARAFDENSAGRADVHRIEVITVLDVGGVGEAELFVDSFLLFELLAAIHSQSYVVNGSGAERPASGRAIRVMLEDQSTAWPSGSNFKPMIRAFLAGLAKAKSLGKETLAFGDLPHGEDGAIESPDGFTAPDLVGGPAFPVVVRFFEYFEGQSRRMLESNEFLAEPFLNAGVRSLMPIELIFPERQGSLRRRISCRGDLARALTPLFLAVGEGGHHRTRLGVLVGIVQVVNRNLAIHEDGLLHHAQAKNLGEKVDILLGSAGTRGDVVDACYWVVHCNFSFGPSSSMTATEGNVDSAFVILPIKSVELDTCLLRCIGRGSGEDFSPIR